MNEREVKDFYFKQLRKVAIGSPAIPDDTRVSLLACSSLYGLTFLATSSGLCVFETAVLDSVDKVTTSSKNTHSDLSALNATHFITPSPPLYLSLSCDSLTLCLAWREDDILSLNFYDTRAIVKANDSNLQPFCRISPNSTPGINVSELQWNPGSPELVGVCLSSGALYVLEVKEDVKVVTSQPDMMATCLCWSPKGKQLALGLKDGSIIQYSHKTCSVKQQHACPDTFNGVAQQVTDIHWVSTYMFAVVYTPRIGGGSPTSIFLSTPKNGNVEWSDWGDIYYGGTERTDNFFYTHFSPWNLLMTSSGNGLETVVFNQLDGDGGWERWELQDNGRAEVPLIDGEETHVAGMAVSLCSTCNIQISDTLIFPPSPLLLLYSTAGILCPFWCIHEGKSQEQLASVVKPPIPLPTQSVRIALPPTPAPEVGTQFRASSIMAAAISSSSGTTTPNITASSQPTISQTVRPQPPTSTTPLQFRPPPPASTTALQFRSPPPTSTTALQFRPQPPTSTTPLQFRPQPPTSTTPLQFCPSPPTSTTPLQYRPPPPTYTSQLQFRPPTPSNTTQQQLQFHPPPPSSATPFQFRPPPPSSTTPFQFRPPPPSSTTPLQFRPPPPTGITLQFRPPPPTSTTPLQPPPPTSVVPLGTTVRPQYTSQQKPLVPVTNEIPQVRPQITTKSSHTTTSSTNVPPTKDDTLKLETTFSTYIREEIDRFVDDLEEFKEDIESMFGSSWFNGESVGGLGSVQYAVEVREETEEVERCVAEAVKCVKILSDGCHQLKDDVLKGLELSEKARVGVKKGSDREHALRQKVRPLDPENMRKLNNIRQMFLSVDQSISEVNGQLDAEIQKRRMDFLQKGRSMLRPPSIQMVYSSLRDHNKLIRLQDERVAHVVSDMKKLKFIPISWTPDHPQYSSRRVAQPPNIQREEQIYQRKPQVEKLNKLREYLRNIETIPVRRVKPKAVFITTSPTNETELSTPLESGRSSPASSIPHYLVSGGSKPQLYKKTSEGFVHKLALAQNDITPDDLSILQTPVNDNPTLPTIPSREYVPTLLPATVHVTDSGTTSSHTVSWGVPGIGGDVGRAEGHSQIPRPTGDITLPFSLSLLSGTVDTGSLSTVTMPTITTTVSTMTSRQQSMFTIGSSALPTSVAPPTTLGRAASMPTGLKTVFSSSSSFKPDLRLPTPSFSQSSPFVFSVSPQSTVFGQQQVSNISTSISTGITSVPMSIMTFTATTTQSCPTQHISTTSTTSIQMAAPQVAVVASSKPPVAVVASTVPPVAVVTSAAAPVAVVASTIPPVAVVTSAAAPVAVVASTIPPVAVVTSAAAPVAVVASTIPPVAVVTSAAAPVAVVTSAAAPVAVVALTIPPVAVVTLAAAPVAVVASTTSTVPPVISHSTAGGLLTASSGSLGLKSTDVATTAVTGSDEMEDDMEQVTESGLQAPSPATPTASGLFSGGLGGLGLGGPPPTSAHTTNPFGSSGSLGSGVGMGSGIGLGSDGSLGSSGGLGSGVGMASATAKSPFSTGSVSLFGQSPRFGQSSIFGATAGPSLGGGPPPINLGGMFGGAARTEELSFGTLAGNQGNSGIAGQNSQQGFGFNSGSGGFGAPSLSGSSFSGWRR